MDLNSVSDNGSSTFGGACVRYLGVPVKSVKKHVYFDKASSIQRVTNEGNQCYHCQGSCYTSRQPYDANLLLDDFQRYSLNSIFGLFFYGDFLETWNSPKRYHHISCYRSPFGKDPTTLIVTQYKDKTVYFQIFFPRKRPVPAHASTLR